MIDMAYSETNSSLIDILRKKYKLMDHFNALRRYLLLGRSDFIRRLMDLAESELNKSAPMLVYQNLQGVLNKTISETNARFEPSYIISCLDIRLLRPAPFDLGWDVFSLDYNVNGPLKTIFTDECLSRYLRIFNFLWQAKRMEYITRVTWSSRNADMEKFRTIPEFYEVIYKSNIVSLDMLRIVQNLNFYFMFEVLEVSWKKLEERLNSAKDIDDVIDANETFLDTTTSQLFLDHKSCQVYIEIRTIFDLIVRMASLKEEFQKLAISEFEARSDFRRRLNECQDPAMKETMECEEKRRYHQDVKNRMRTSKKNIDVLTMTFNDMLKRLLEMLKNHSSENLRFLSFQFNFIEYDTPKETKGNGF